MKKQLQEKDYLNAKLLSYSAAAGALLALGADAEAQIMYTDIDPDSLVTIPDTVERANTFEIDMNNDGIVDLTIVAGNGDWYYDSGSYPNHWWSIRAYPENGAEVVVAPSYISYWGNTYWLAKRFDADDIIGSDPGTSNYWSGPLLWNSIYYSWQLGMVGSSYSTYYNYGEWNDGATDKFLGIRFSLDEGTTFHYGWIRMDVAQDHTQVLIKDYAYESRADMAIPAGATKQVSVKDDLADELGVKVFAHERNIIVSDLKADRAQAEVYNVTGQLLRSVQVETGRTEIPMDNQGLYIVRIDVEGEIVSSKVIVK
jgi:hypothetical protein